MPSGASAAAATICKNVTDQAIKHRQVTFHIPTTPSSSPACVSEVVLRCSSYPYATAVCFALGELPVTLPKPHSKRLLQTSHAIQNKKKKSLINLIQKERKKERHNNKKKNTPFRASCCWELQKVLLLFVPKWLLLVTENTCLLLFGFRRRVPTC